MGVPLAGCSLAFSGDILFTGGSRVSHGAAILLWRRIRYLRILNYSQVS